MVVVGNGASRLEDTFAGVLRSRTELLISPDPEPEKGSFYRSDHISLAKVGVPSCTPVASFDAKGSKKAGLASARLSRTHHYHQPSDASHPNWDLSGPLESAVALFAFGRKARRQRSFTPNWYKGNESSVRSRTSGSLAAK